MNKIFSPIIALALFAVVVAPAYAVTTVVYDALPSVTPDTSYPSQPFQAQQTFEFGDYIHLGGANRKLDNVTFTMVTWAKFADYSTNPLYMNNSTSWTHPITLNIYSSALNPNGTPSTLLATITKDVTIPWRPVADPTCPDLKWKDSTGSCNNGYAFNANFDLSSLNVTLPNDIIVSLAYNTQSYGTAPIGVDGPYNSLNVAVPENQPVTVGTDDNVAEVFWNTITPQWYADGGVGGVGVFRKDTNWAPYGTIALRVETTIPLVGPPTDKDQCKKDGWKLFNNPVFKNQGQCVSFVEKQKEDKHEDKDKDKDRDNDKDKDKKHDGRDEKHGKKD